MMFVFENQGKSWKRVGQDDLLRFFCLHVLQSPDLWTPLDNWKISIFISRDHIVFR